TQETPETLEWEIVVVDNGSNDRTEQVCRTVARPVRRRLRYVFEPQLGKSRALNAGIAVARGSVIALTDDDVSPAMNWVATAAGVLDKWAVDGAGGRILPQWEKPPPAWLLEHPWLRGHLGVMDINRPAILSAPSLSGPQVWGGNMVFRREALQTLGGFDVRLGPVGKRRYCDEDVDFVHRMLTMGRRIVYDPTLTVFHRIPRARVARAYF